MNHPKIRNCYFIICNISESDAKFIHMTFFFDWFTRCGNLDGLYFGWFIYTQSNHLEITRETGDCDAQCWPRTLNFQHTSLLRITYAAE